MIYLISLQSPLIKYFIAIFLIRPSKKTAVFCSQKNIQMEAFQATESISLKSNCNTRCNIVQLILDERFQDFSPPFDHLPFFVTNVLICASVGLWIYLLGPLDKSFHLFAVYIDWFVKVATPNALSELTLEGMTFPPFSRYFATPTKVTLFITSCLQFFS